jgi:hypothetical protein
LDPVGAFSELGGLKIRFGRIVKIAFPVFSFPAFWRAENATFDSYCNQHFKRTNVPLSSFPEFCRAENETADES